MEQKIIVQKFGGSSLATEQGRLAAAGHVATAVEDGLGVVVVVSAMGRSGDAFATDTLLGVLGATYTASASAHDLDILMSCGEAISAVTFGTLLRHQGHKVTVLSGSQAGIRTDEEHGDARILDIHPHRILGALECGHVVVVMGFQGSTAEGEITTLGRGGSDTSATALGVALGAAYVDIFTDVDGIMTADPRIVPDAACIARASYSEICHLAHHGAKVIHPTAVQMAMSGNVPIRVRSTFSQEPGTWIGSTEEVRDDAKHAIWFPGGVTSTPETWYVQFDCAHLAEDALAEVKGLLGNTGYVDVVDNSMGITPASHNKVHVAQMLGTWKGKASELKRCAKVAVIGSGDHKAVRTLLDRANQALHREGIEVVRSASSSHALWFLVDPSLADEAVNVLHREFNLGELERTAVTV